MLLLRESGTQQRLWATLHITSSSQRRQEEEEEEEALRATLFPKPFQPYFPSKRNILHFRCLDYFQVRLFHSVSSLVET